MEKNTNAMCMLLEKWMAIDSYSYHEKGIEEMLSTLKEAFARLQPERSEILNGRHLHIVKRGDARFKFLCGGHCDTVHAKTWKAEKVGEYLQGPGSADMKGGLAVLLFALDAFERSPEAKNAGWEVLINSDEEIGSATSTPLFAECAQRCQVAFLFEPALPDGSLVSHRSGSANFHVVAKGIEAHAGRNPSEGENAIFKLATWVTKVAALNDLNSGTLLNVGTIRGGTAPNVVPSHAECLVNLRAATIERFEACEKSMREFGRDLFFEKLSYRPPKALDAKTEQLLLLAKSCAVELHIPLRWQGTGGVCDGNTTAQFIPTLDTLGVIGEYIHTPQERLLISSLESRAALATLLMRKVTLKRKAP